MENKLGKRIANLRKEKNLKQEDLAQMLNISPQAISKWENDLTCPDISILPQLSNILGVSIDELLVGKKESEIVKVLSQEERKELKDVKLKIQIFSAEKDKITINLPMAFLEVAIGMGLDIENISGNSKLKSIDLNKIIELVKQGVVGNLMEIETSEQDIIKISVE